MPSVATMACKLIMHGALHDVGESVHKPETKKCSASVSVAFTRHCCPPDSYTPCNAQRRTVGIRALHASA
jgi:hypothetical protein